MTPIESVIERVLRREGGIADVEDGQGLTRFGQTPGWLQAHGLPAPETREQAAVNYAAWLVKTGLDAVATEDDLLVDAVIDFAVHAGEARAVRALQSAIGARPDGQIGPQTRAALVGIDRAKVARRVLADRLKHLGVLITADPAHQARYAKGWLARVADQIAHS